MTLLLPLAQGPRHHSPFLLAQLTNFLLLVAVIILFVRAAGRIMERGKGLEVPVWLFLAFCIPIVFPILALVYFRNRPHNTEEGA